MYIPVYALEHGAHTRLFHSAPLVVAFLLAVLLAFPRLAPIGVRHGFLWITMTIAAQLVYVHGEMQLMRTAES